MNGKPSSCTPGGFTTALVPVSRGVEPKEGFAVSSGKAVHALMRKLAPRSSIPSRVSPPVGASAAGQVAGSPKISSTKAAPASNAVAKKQEHGQESPSTTAIESAHAPPSKRRRTEKKDDVEVPLEVKKQADSAKEKPKRSRSKAFTFSQFHMPTGEEGKAIRQRVAQRLAKAPSETTRAPTDLTFQQESVLKEISQFCALDGLGLCLEFLFMGKGDRQLGSAVRLRQRLESGEPLAGDFYAARDVYGLDGDDVSPSEMNEPGIIHYGGSPQLNSRPFEE